MGMNQQDRDKLSNNWDAAKAQIKSQFPGVTDADLGNGKTDHDTLVGSISDRTGQTRESVESGLQQVARSVG